MSNVSPITHRTMPKRLFTHPRFIHRFPYLPTLLRYSQHDRWLEQAKFLTLSKKATQRLDWLIWFREHGRNVSATCRHFHIAPKTFRHWRDRFDGANLRLLEDQDMTPKRRRVSTVTPEERARIVALRTAHLRWGKVKLKLLYERRFGTPISAWKIEQVIRQQHLYANPAKARRTAAKRKRAQRKKRITEIQKEPRRGFLVQLDTIVVYWNGLKRYILTAIDVTTKLAFARMYTTKSSRSAADFLRRFHTLMDAEIEHSQTDNGSEFAAEFETACLDLNVVHVFSRVKTPNDNATVERFNRTLQEEFLQDGHFHTDPDIFNTQVTQWLLEYNFERPHQTLSYRTPADAVRTTPDLGRRYPALTLF
jgi:transposase InsO family protein